jgi:hypothetical protein
MADQNFDINIRTLADLTGIKLTQQQLDALQTAAANNNKEAINALKKLTAAQNEALKAQNTGFTGGVVGVSTFLFVLNRALTAVQKFNQEEMKWVETTIKAQEESRKLGLALVDMWDAARSAERMATEPLEDSFNRLTYDVQRLKTEMKLAFETGAYDDAKKLNGELKVTEQQLKHVTEELKKQKEAAEKAAEAAERDANAFLKSAVQTASPQTQAVLKNEEAARQAAEAGRDRDAALYQKSADQLKKSMTQAQREEYEGLTKPVRLGRKAGPGESQDILDDMARNQINFQRQLKGEPPLPAGAAQGNQDLRQAIQQAFEGAMAKYWGP